MTKNTYAQRSQDIDSKLRKKLIEQSEFIKNNASIYLDTYSVPLDGNGKIVTTFNSIKKHAKPIIFSKYDSVKASIDTNKQTGVLISCSHRRAGGGWLSGSFAQEETISRTSTWAVQADLSKFKNWYSQDKHTHWLGQKGSLVIDGLFILDENNNELKEPKKVVFAGVAAANKAALGNDSYWDSGIGLKERQNFLVENLACAFHELYKRGVEEVILCAFGTNVFGWKFEDSIQVLYEATKLAPNKLNFICAVCNDQKVSLAKLTYQNLLENDKELVNKTSSVKNNI